MHLTKIKQEAGYLGPHPRIIKKGQVYNLLSQDNNEGTFCMNPEEREAKRQI